MANHIVNSYDKELLSLTTSIVNMGLMVRDVLDLANKSVQEIGTDYVEITQAIDHKINQADLEIEQQATNILALRQPMAIDLRQAISALKLAVIMERMGDLAKNITKRTIQVKAPLEHNIASAIERMVNLVSASLTDVLEAFRKNDDAMARSIPARDQDVDKIYSQLMNILESGMVANQELIPSYIQIIYAIKNIERIGDYVTKIAIITHYVVTGERSFKDRL